MRITARPPGHDGEHRIVAIANMRARQAWAMLARDENYDPNAWLKHPMVQRPATARRKLAHAAMRLPDQRPYKIWQPFCSDCASLHFLRTDFSGERCCH